MHNHSTVPRRIRRVVLPFALLAPNALSAQQAAQSLVTFGNCARSLPDVTDSIDKIVMSTMARGRVPAVALAIVTYGHVRTVRAYGWADLEHCVPATDSTLFGIGSVSKQFAGFAALVLVRSGKLSLDDPITKFLPEGRAVWKDITIRNLLTHTSGIPDYTGDDDKYPSARFDRTASPSTDSLVREIASLPLNFKPGDDWAYSGLGYILLCVIAERVSGRPFPDFMREQVFLPLGMSRTRFYSPTELINGRAIPYRLTEGGEVIHGPFISDAYSRWADTGMMSTAHDMARWIVAMDSAKLVSRELWSEMWNSVRLNQQWTFPYGLGFFIGEMQGEAYVGHGGTFRVGYSAALIRWPARRTTISVLSNMLSSSFKPRFLAQEIFATVNPGFVPVTRLTPQPDPQPKLSLALSRLLMGKNETEGAIHTTEAFRTLQLKEIQQLASGGSIVYLGCRQASPRAAPAFGTRVDRVCTYEIPSGAQQLRVMFFLTSTNEVAGADW